MTTNVLRHYALVGDDSQVFLTVHDTQARAVRRRNRFTTDPREELMWQEVADIDEAELALKKIIKERWQGCYLRRLK